MNAAIVTQRLRLEPLVVAHAPFLFEPLSDPKLYTFMPKDPPIDRDALVARFTRLEARQSPDGLQHWLNWVARSRETNQYVGSFEATVEQDVAHVAYFVFSAFQRRGFAHEALEAMMTALAQRADVERFVANIDTRNAASIALVRSLGFTLERTTPGADHFKGAPSDEHRFVRRGRS